MSETDSEYLTTKELAQLLRIKERKVYDLAASGELPCSRAMGKLLFPRSAVQAWLTRSSSGAVQAVAIERPNVLLGSHDPLLEWAVRESRCGLATFLDGSLDGLERYARGEGVVAGLHVYEPGQDQWNTALVHKRLSDQPVALLEWSWRERGLILAPPLQTDVSGIADLRGRRLVARQAEAGSQTLLDYLLAQGGLTPDDVDYVAVARSETDAAVFVLEGKADAAFGLLGVARQYRLPFVPVVKERFDLIVDRRSWFEPPLQRLFSFFRSAAFATRAAELLGYDISSLGQVHYNSKG
jgi:excisionase family DNA binding protein